MDGAPRGRGAPPAGAPAEALYAARTYLEEYRSSALAQGCWLVAGLALRSLGNGPESRTALQRAVDLNRELGRFFDRAVYYASAGYTGYPSGALADAFTVLAVQEDLYTQNEELWRSPELFPAASLFRATSCWRS